MAWSRFADIFCASPEDSDACLCNGIGVFLTNMSGNSMAAALGFFL